jgi:hypothetical protein
MSRAPKAAPIAGAAFFAVAGPLAAALIFLALFATSR